MKLLEGHNDRVAGQVSSSNSPNSPHNLPQVASLGACEELFLLETRRCSECQRI